MKKHIAAVHERKKPHKCKWCDRGFDSKKDLTRHIEWYYELTSFQGLKGGKYTKSDRFLANNKHSQR